MYIYIFIYLYMCIYMYIYIHSHAQTESHRRSHHTYSMDMYGNPFVFWFPPFLGQVIVLTELLGRDYTCQELRDHCDEGHTPWPWIPWIKTSPRLHMQRHPEGGSWFYIFLHGFTEALNQWTPIISHPSHLLPMLNHQWQVREPISKCWEAPETCQTQLGAVGIWFGQKCVGSLGVPCCWFFIIFPLCFHWSRLKTSFLVRYTERLNCTSHTCYRSYGFLCHLPEWDLKVYTVDIGTRPSCDCAASQPVESRVVSCCLHGSGGTWGPDFLKGRGLCKLTAQSIFCLRFNKVMCLKWSWINHEESRHDHWSEFSCSNITTVNSWCSCDLLRHGSCNQKGAILSTNNVLKLPTPAIRVQNLTWISAVAVSA